MPRPLLAVALLALAGSARAADPPDPLRLVPKEAGFVLKVENPRQLVETVRGLDAYRNLQNFPNVREVLDSTSVRRFFQLVAYLEQEFGAAWPDVVDRVAGGGVAVGSKLGEENAPALFVVQGTDAAAVAKAYTLFLRLLEQDQSAGASLRKATRGGVETVHVGSEFHAARVGAAILLSNREAALHAGLDLASGKATASILSKPTVPAARKLLGRSPLAWTWFDLAAAKQTPGGKDFFANTKKDLFQTVAFGSTADAAGRADFVAAGLVRTPAGFALTVRLPAERKGLPKEMRIHAPADDTPGSLPLLEPQGVLYSQSLYLDLGHLWRERKAILNPEVLKDVEKGEKDISKVLPGTTLGKLLEQSGPHWRFVAAHTGESLYAVKPGQPIPPFAVVASMRDRQFGETMDGVLRAAALLAGAAAGGLKLSETTADGVKVVTYRYDEKGKYPGDDGDLRFNFAPSFAVVGDSLVVGSTPGIVTALIPELKKPADPAKCSPAVWRAKVYAAGGADLLAAYPDATVTQTVLSQGIGLDEATRQVTAFAGWLRTLGTAGLTIEHGERFYRFDLDWSFGK